MANIKLITRSRVVADAPEYKTVDARGWDRDRIMNMVFRNYSTLYVLIYNRKDLIAPAYAYFPDVTGQGDEEIHGSICRDVSVRTHSKQRKDSGGLRHYDVYKLWYKTESLPATRMSVDWLFSRLFGDTLVDVWHERGGPVTAEDMAKIDPADLRYPILLHQDYSSIDGLHRLAKAKKIHRRYINCIIVPSRILRACEITDWVSDDEYRERFTA
jgi:hypothetical protein